MQYRFFDNLWEAEKREIISPWWRRCWPAGRRWGTMSLTASDCPRRWPRTWLIRPRPPAGTKVSGKNEKKVPHQAILLLPFDVKFVKKRFAAQSIRVTVFSLHTLARAAVRVREMKRRWSRTRHRRLVIAFFEYFTLSNVNNIKDHPLAQNSFSQWSLTKHFTTILLPES